MRLYRNAIISKWVIIEMTSQGAGRVAVMKLKNTLRRLR